MPVIGILPGQLITEKLSLPIKADNSGNVAAKPDHDLNKIAVIERHKESGRVAVALVKGMGLKEGALASSVAHDSHNIIVVGVEEAAMAAAVNEINRLRGGFVAVDGSGNVKAALPLAIGGLMSLKPASEVADEMNKLLQAAEELGSRLPQPFLTMSFLALPVIPSLKITDRGLFDVDNFSFI
jgi:adenine deaminase